MKKKIKTLCDKKKNCPNTWKFVGNPLFLNYGIESTPLPVAIEYINLILFCILNSEIKQIW